MNSEKRVLTALNLEVPDRVPVHTVALAGSQEDEILGKPSVNTFDMLENIQTQNSDGWIDEINKSMDDLQAGIFGRMMEAAAEIGFDTSMTGYIPLKFTAKDKMSDIFGRKYKIVSDKGHIFPYYIEGMIHDRKDWEKWPEPDINKICQRASKVFKAVLERVKGKIFVMAADDYTSVFPPVWQGMGMNSFVKCLKRDPALIKERFEMTTELVKKLFRTYYEAGARVFFEGGDIAYKSGPLINPKYITEYVLPSYRKLTEEVHSWGEDCKIIFHSDGDITSILDFIVDSGFDALHCLEPTSNVDAAYVKRKVGDKLCLLGNIDTMHVLTEGTKKEVETAVKDVIKAAGHGGGFILSPSNSHPTISVQNLKWMIEETKKSGIYPLKL
ncbi:MAG: uroporphyrinogen decarboxylase family protein [Promethearchaeota archaeon]